MLAVMVRRKGRAHNARVVRLCFAALGVLGVLKIDATTLQTVGRATEERDALSEPDSSPPTFQEEEPG